MNTDMKFISNGDGGWQGNNMGTTTNSYKAVIDGQEIGTINKSSVTDQWVFYRRQSTFIDGVEFDYEVHPSKSAATLPELKNKVRAFYSI